MWRDSRPPILKIVLLCVITLGVLGCQLPSSGDFGIPVKTKSITLEWDPPHAYFAAPGINILYYSVYIRVHGSSTWTFVDSILPSENPSLTVYHSDFGDGWYEFAVSASTYLGGESRLHSSIDPTARPFGGWYIKWEYSD